MKAWAFLLLMVDEFSLSHSLVSGHSFYLAKWQWMEVSNERWITGQLCQCIFHFNGVWLIFYPRVRCEVSPVSLDASSPRPPPPPPPNPASSKLGLWVIWPIVKVKAKRKERAREKGTGWTWKSMGTRPHLNPNGSPNGGGRVMQRLHWIFLPLCQSVDSLDSPDTHTVTWTHILTALVVDTHTHTHIDSFAYT